MTDFRLTNIPKKITFFKNYHYIVSNLPMHMLKRVWMFYYDGFRSMTVGKTLWIIIGIKLFIMFFILKLFFFRPELAKYKTEEEKSKVVIENLTK